MRPVRLEMEGFASYQTPTEVDFNGLHLVAVVGNTGSGKCLAAGSRVWDGKLGVPLPIEDFVAERRAMTYGLSGGKIVAVPVTDWLSLGEKPCVEVTLADGSTLVAATTHPVLTDKGCRPAGGLTTDDWVAQASALPEASFRRFTVAEAMLVGLLLGDGCVTKGVSFSATEPEHAAMFKRAIEEVFPGATVRTYDEKAHVVVAALKGDDRRRVILDLIESLDEHQIDWAHFTSTRNEARARRGQAALSWEVLVDIERSTGLDLYEFRCKLHPSRELRLWLETLGLLGCNSSSKFIPPELLHQPSEVGRSLLAGLLTTDGYIQRPPDNGRAFGLTYDTASLQLARDLRLLLLSLGIRSSLRLKRVKETFYYEIRLAADSVRDMVALPLPTLKAAALEAQVSKLRERSSVPLRDYIPPAFAKGIDHRGFRHAERLKSSPLRRDIFLRAGGSPEVAGQQTCWQRVVKVASVGNRPCYDLTVDTPEHLYLTEAVIVHNSSILDAVNFAVWGKTRAGGIDTIVNNKGTEAKVRFTFELGGSMYRVSRVRSLGKTTGVTFEVGVDEHGELAWKPVGDGLVRGTDEEVRRVLGMNYDTFVATVFLGQGDADRFTADATPKARKEILADILGLDAYGLVAKAANEEARRLKATGAALVAQADEIDGQLADKAAVEAELAEAKDQCRSLQEEAAKAQERLGQLQHDVSALDACQDRIAQLNKDIAALRAKRLEERQRTERLVASAANAVERGHRERAKAEQRLADALAAASEAAQLKGQRDSADAAKAAADQDLARVTDEGVTLKGEMATLKGEIANIEARLQETDAHLDAVSTDSANAVCYTCGQDVSTERRAGLIGTLAAESRELEARLAGARDRLGALEADRAAKLAEHSAAKDAVTKLDARLSGLVRSYEQAAARAGGQAGAEDDRAELDKQLLEAQEHLDVATGALGERGDDDPAEAVLAAQVAAQEALVASGASTRQDFDHARAQCQAVEQALQEATRAQGSLEAKVSHLDALEAKLSSLQDQTGRILDDVRVQEHLACAFGRDGIPAMILNGVVSELDNVVNEVLATLSGGTLGVRIETQREKKTGGVADTLEVIVSDGVTDRPYATFSGGERFKIDLALRVGLAKLLSRRSGTPIRTLAIDEGWGSLDPDGVQAMIECLHTLAADFDCLITISHVPAVADGFATRLVVNKTPFGSAIEICV